MGKQPLLQQLLRLPGQFVAVVWDLILLALHRCLALPIILWGWLRRRYRSDYGRCPECGDALVARRCRHCGVVSDHPAPTDSATR